MTKPTTTHSGREYRISDARPDAENYPRRGVHEWQEFAGLAIEMGGYSDLTAIDPYTGRSFWLGHAFTCDVHAAALAAATPGDQAMAVYAAKQDCAECGRSTITAIRRLLDAMEAAGFPDSFRDAEGETPNRASV